MAKRGRKPKDEFANLSDEFKASVYSKNEDDIRKLISEVSLAQVALNDAKKSDQDLAEAHARYKDANAVYADGTKENKLKIRFCRRALNDKGARVPEFSPNE